MNKILPLALIIAGFAFIAYGLLSWEDVVDGDKTFVQFMAAPGIGALLLLTGVGMRMRNRP